MHRLIRYVAVGIVLVACIVVCRGADAQVTCTSPGGTVGATIRADKFGYILVRICGSDGESPGSSSAVPATYTQTAVTVAANTSTQLIGVNSTRKKLDIVPIGGNQTCAINDAGGTATATSKPIPGGWSYAQTDPPPNGAVNIFCTSAATISVTEGN